MGLRMRRAYKRQDALRQTDSMCESHFNLLFLTTPRNFSRHKQQIEMALLAFINSDSRLLKKISKNVTNVSVFFMKICFCRNSRWKSDSNILRWKSIKFEKIREMH